MKGVNILGFDPAYRTGCKLAVIDETGKLHKTAVIYPHPPVNKPDEAKLVLIKLIQTYHVNLIAIGNGTASRESELFVADVLRSQPDLNVCYALVS